jgi:uncharacterized protein
MPSLEFAAELLDSISLDMVAFALALLAAGLVAGVISGLFGVGGGAVIVPVLYQFFIALDIDSSIIMQLAVGTSLGIIVPTSLRSFQSHLAHDAVDVPYLRKMAVWVFLGVLLGSLVAVVVSGAQLRALFAVLALAMAMKMLFSSSDFQLWEDFPPSPLFEVLTSLMGFFSVLMGIGGGVFNNVFMTLFGRSIHKAVATSSGVGVLISIPGVLGFIWAGLGDQNLPAFSLGFVNLLGVLLVIPASVIAAPYGARLAHKLSKTVLQKSFAVFLIIVSIRFFASLL